MGPSLVKSCVSDVVNSGCIVKQRELQEALTSNCPPSGATPSSTCFKVNAGKMLPTTPNATETEHDEVVGSSSTSPHNQPSVSNAPVFPLATKPTKNLCRFSNDEDHIIVRKVAAVKAHVAPHGERRERFETANAKVNGIKRLKHAVTWKSMQDRNKRLQDRYDQRDAIDAKLSGVGGDICEVDKLLSMIKEAQDDFLQAQEEKSRMQEELKENKKRLEAFIKQRATRRRDSKNGSDGSDEGKGERPSKKSKASRSVSSPSVDNETAFSIAAIESGDAYGLKLEEDRMKLEREQFKAVEKEKVLEREERKREREESQKLDIQNFEMIMDVIRGIPAATATRETTTDANHDDAG